MASLPYPRRHQTIFPQKPQNLTQPKNLWASVKSVGEYFRQSFLWVLRILWEDLTQPNHLWASVKSVGEYSSPVVSVNSVNSVGGYALFAWLVQLGQLHPLGGWRGYGRDAIPSYDCLVGALETSAPPERLLQAFYLFY